MQLNYRYQDRQFVSTATGPAVPNNILYSIPGYGMLDARLTWSKDLPNRKRVRVSIWGKNVTARHALQDLVAQGAFLPVPGTPVPATPTSRSLGPPHRSGESISRTSYRIPYATGLAGTEREPRRNNVRRRCA